MLVRRPSVLGRVPVKRFEVSRNAVVDDMPPISEGSEPARALFRRSNHRTAVRLPTEGGRLPLIDVPEMTSVVRSESFPRSSGRVPASCGKFWIWRQGGGGDSGKRGETGWRQGARAEGKRVHSGEFG